MGEASTITCVREWGLCVSFDVSFRKFEHEAIDLLCLSRETERLQECAESVDEPSIP